MDAAVDPCQWYDHEGKEEEKECRTRRDLDRVDRHEEDAAGSEDDNEGNEEDENGDGDRTGENGESEDEEGEDGSDEHENDGVDMEE